MTDTPKIYSRRKGSEPSPVGARYVDRGTEWGNPFPMLRDSPAERERVCELFEQYALETLKENPDWLLPLAGRDLVCWCKPKPTSRIRCHAETLIRLANDGRYGEGGG